MSYPINTEYPVRFYPNINRTIFWVNNKNQVAAALVSAGFEHPVFVMTHDKDFKERSDIIETINKKEEWVLIVDEASATGWRVKQRANHIFLDGFTHDPGIVIQAINRIPQ